MDCTCSLIAEDGKPSLRHPYSDACGPIPKGLVKLSDEEITALDNTRREFRPSTSSRALFRGIVARAKGTVTVG